jgi:hypothetical protein
MKTGTESTGQKPNNHTIPTKTEQIVNTCVLAERSVEKRKNLRACAEVTHKWLQSFFGM